jgi:hypothetical protein
MSEMIAHAEETKADGIPIADYEKDGIDLEKGHCYLIKEEKPQKAYDYFRHAMNSGMRCLCITRDPPQKAKEKHNIPNSLVLWFSSLPSSHAMQPKMLENFAMSLTDFMSQEEGSFILIDCMEYLITNNDFKTVLRLFQNIRDGVIDNKAILMISTNPAALGPHEINRLESEMDTEI